MTDLSCKRDGTKVDREVGGRADFYRNRSCKSFLPSHLVTDGAGNILERPLIKKPPLPCFGDPVECLRGEFDRPREYKDQKPQPRGCALCPVRAGRCDKVAYERIESDPALATLQAGWQRETKHLVGIARYRHGSWGAFVRACNTRTWIDSHDKAEEDDLWNRASRNAASVKSKRNAAKPRPKAVPKAIANNIAQERDRRKSELLNLRSDPNSPLWIRNRTPERCVLVADAWQGRMILEEGNRKASGRAVLDWLKSNGRVQGNPPDRFVKTIQEALRAADRHWPDLFDPDPEDFSVPHVAGSNMHPSVVHTILDEDD